ncbi:MAG: hypothetical protein K2Y32_18935 [Candidatus Obscuribacterales bacterium]|nr:hypothetical protein [Candidatus Obscuribacterales bacterium]
MSAKIAHKAHLANYAKAVKRRSALAALLAFSLFSFGISTTVLAQKTLTGSVETLQSGASASVLPGAVSGSIPGFIDNSRFELSVNRSSVVKPPLFKAWLEKNNPDLQAILSANDQNAIVEVAGRWDHADKTLKSLGLSYRHIKSKQITEELLQNTKVLILNCAGELKRDKLQLVRDFVARGGYLLSTDWALDNAVELAFPGTISFNKGLNKKPIYQANFVSPDAVLAAGTVYKAYWKLDQEAHLVRILDSRKVRVLVSSPDLALEDPDGKGILACVFPFGRGYVLHMTGHFDNNAAISIGDFLPDGAPSLGIALRQALATNFVMAALRGQSLAVAH